MTPPKHQAFPNLTFKQHQKDEKMKPKATNKKWWQRLEIVLRLSIFPRFFYIALMSPATSSSSLHQGLER